MELVDIIVAILFIIVFIKPLSRGGQWLAKKILAIPEALWPSELEKASTKKK